MNKLSISFLVAAIVFALASIIIPSRSEAQSHYQVAVCEEVADMAETAASSYYEDFSVLNYYETLRRCQDEALVSDVETFCETMHDYAWRLPRHTDEDAQAEEISRYKRSSYLICLRVHDA